MRIAAGVLGLLAIAAPAAADAAPELLKQGLAAHQAGDFSAAANALLAAAKAGDSAAQYSLGRLYFAGEGVRQSSAEALHWYRRAAEQGHAAAQYQLGVWSEFGWELPADGAQAERWYLRAARQGHRGAMVHLGFLYAMGRLVERDRIRAYLWFDRAAAGGFSAGRSARDWLAFVMPEEELVQARRAAMNWHP